MQEDAAAYRGADPPQRSRSSRRLDLRPRRSSASRRRGPGLRSTRSVTESSARTPYRWRQAGRRRSAAWRPRGPPPARPGVSRESKDQRRPTTSPLGRMTALTGCATAPFDTTLVSRVPLPGGRTPRLERRRLEATERDVGQRDAGELRAVRRARPGRALAEGVRGGGRGGEHGGGESGEGELLEHDRVSFRVRNSS